MNDHSKLLPPSGAHRWLECNASSQMQNENEPLGCDTLDADIGTAAHWVASDMIDSYHHVGGVDPNNMPRTIGDYLGKIAPNGILIDSDILESVDIYVNHVLELSQRNHLGGVLRTEHRVTVPDVHEQCFGTVDCAAYDAKRMTLHVIDYKHGHSFVDVVNNAQLILYASGLLSELKADGMMDQHIKVVMTIVQPRCYSSDTVRTWEVMASDLRGMINRLRSAAINIYSGHPTSKTGSHCKNCTAMTTCDIAHKHLSNIVGLVGSMDVAKVSPDKYKDYLAFMKSSLKLMEYMSLSLTTQATHLIESGTIVKGLTVQPKYGRSSWKVDDDKVIQLGEMTGLDLIKGYKLMTPNQALKLGMSSRIVDKCSARPFTGMKLVESDTSEFQKQLKESKQ